MKNIKSMSVALGLSLVLASGVSAAKKLSEPIHIRVGSFEGELPVETIESIRVGAKIRTFVRRFSFLANAGFGALLGAKACKETSPELNTTKNICICAGITAFLFGRIGIEIFDLMEKMFYKFGDSISRCYGARCTNLYKHSIDDLLSTYGPVMKAETNTQALTSIQEDSKVDDRQEESSKIDNKKKTNNHSSRCSTAACFEPSRGLLNFKKLAMRNFLS